MAKSIIPLPFEYIQLPTFVLLALTPPELHLLCLIYVFSEANDHTQREVGGPYQSPYSLGGAGVRFTELRENCSSLGRSRIMTCLQSLAKLGLIQKSPGWKPIHPAKWDAALLETRKAELWAQRLKLKEADEPSTPNEVSTANEPESDDDDE